MSICLSMCEYTARQHIRASCSNRGASHQQERTQSRCGIDIMLYFHTNVVDWNARTDGERLFCTTNQPPQSAASRRVSNVLCIARHTIVQYIVRMCAIFARINRHRCAQTHEHTLTITASTLHSLAQNRSLDVYYLCCKYPWTAPHATSFSERTTRPKQ